MTLLQAIKILDPDTQHEAFKEIEDVEGIDYIDMIITRMREASRIACDIMRQHVEFGEIEEE